MAKRETTLVGSSVTVEQDDATGVLYQKPDSVLQTPGGLTATPPTTGEKFYGVPIILGCRVGIAANSPASATTYRATLLNKNAPCILKVIEIGVQIVDITAGDFTDGDAGNLDVTVIRGDGAGTETETDILADYALDDDFENGETMRFPHGTVFLTNSTVIAGGSLYVDLIVDPDSTAGATNDGCTADVWVTCVPVV